MSIKKRTRARRIRMRRLAQGRPSQGQFVAGCGVVGACSLYLYGYCIFRLPQPILHRPDWLELDQVILHFFGALLSGMLGTFLLVYVGWYLFYEKRLDR